MSAATKAEGRAEPLARERGQYLTFLLGSEVFAVDILRIREIIEYGAITAVPTMPEFIRGVINLRGSVVPIVDLAARFGRKSTPVTRRTCMVIIEAGTDAENQMLGIVVDSVSAVVDIPGADIAPPPAFGARVRTDFVSGMGKVNGGFVIVLDLNRVLSVDEIATLADAGAGQVSAEAA
jgi:purine-binding chemotaxis protein CheW